MGTSTNLYDAVFRRNDGQSPENEAIRTLRGSAAKTTYNSLKGNVDFLRSVANFQSKENVALVMPNSPELIVGLLALWADGAAAVPLNPAYTAAEFEPLFKDLSIKKVVVLGGDDKTKATLQETSANQKIIEISLDGLREGDTRGKSSPPNLDDNTALYLHTSGTTGKPKAVPLKHSNLLRGARNVAETYQLDSTHRTYLLQVLFHIHGIVAALLAPLVTGGSIVIPPGGAIDASRAWSDFQENDCNWVTGTPSILQTLLAAPDPKSGTLDIQFIRSCSSPLLPTVFEALRKRFDCPVIEAYAMTEASHQMCSNRLDDFGSGSVGPESGATKICIWSEGNTAVALGEEGEVCVSGDNVMGGYDGVSDEVNQKAFWQGTDERGNEARWFRTGDRGVLSTDDRRRLTLIGRLSEMINRGGEKISPVEVDEAIMLASDEVKEAASFSVSDDFYGQEVEAAVVLKPNTSLDEAKLQQLLEKRLAAFKIPKKIHFCEDKIPKGPTGKIQRKVLSQLFGQDNSAEAGDGKQKSSEDDVYAIIDRALGIKSGQAKESQSTTLLALGADSMGLSKISSAVERQTGVRLGVAALFAYPTVEEVVDLVQQGTTKSQGGFDAPTKVAPFSLLGSSKDQLEQICNSAGIKIDDLEDAIPLSANQNMYLKVLRGSTKKEHLDNNDVWQMNRYRLANGTDKARLLQTLGKVRQHEESFRWKLGYDDSASSWIILQEKPEYSNPDSPRIREFSCAAEEEATKLMDEELSTYRHRVGTRTLVLYIVSIGEGDSLELELAFIESHLFTEGQGRRLILDTISKAYQNEELDHYTPYSAYVSRFPIGHDPASALEFWEKEVASMKREEKWSEIKAPAYVNPEAWTKDQLVPLGDMQSVNAPFRDLTVVLDMTLPLVVEAVFSLSLALWLSQRDSVFTSGSVVYDRAVSLRTIGDGERLDSVRAVTGSYQPQPLVLDLAARDLWTYLLHFKAMTQIRERKICLNEMDRLACHTAAFTWRFHNDVEDESSSADNDGPLIAGVKAEAMSMRAFHMCFVNANRHGEDGATVAIGFHEKWLDEQRSNGCKVELVEICIKALRFVAENNSKLQELSLEDLRAAVFG
ncbi:Peroxisomal-coenzyme A synthetase [Cercospora beticola]|uniref:Peroxisomal-coenzyme A synthetase n=1 Tax=Cercospora beticola TaxID=122368 RepID=A0A2G5HZZ7_CERBT|nr:Peroxisomal-coenzyme A synthetase [Cercospora beticola]PIA98114.1 Peroxisomal-coenzyme A synthetase [Cercospora beticola]WPA97855.1 hypothetical protein RHO25_002466 [Cercospora beticola]CAK1359052.1 unnamed protein product [Cercospora beticola]